MKTITPQGYFNRNVSRFICFAYAAGYEIHNLTVNGNSLEIECELYYNGFNCTNHDNALAAIAFWRTQNRFNEVRKGNAGTLIFGMVIIQIIKSQQ